MTGWRIHVSDSGDTRTTGDPAGRTDRSHRTVIIAAVITGSATVIAAVIATTVAGDHSPKAPAAITAPPASQHASATPRPVQSLPSTPPPPAPSPTAARIMAAPDSAAIGATVTITGSGFTAEEQVRITFNGTYGSTLDLRDVTAGPDGGFAAEVTVPEDSVDSDQQQSFEVRGLDSDERADTPFHITG
ncbi:IPT/TIG domain-containing protein [Streptomyces sp. NBC_00378]|uniref:IPT/TIG domain-containing protein n=1 Tax=unclassified Streptomyces TaxID=2593676 RepID=UPI0022565C51|nr:MULTISPECIES: IPT/TIG domain-containing protein [unclassified Streptomyces]MCX5110650.1 IPT/TIG domain-containing protein [Streptomyces sp. NBC_00378]